MIPYPSTFHLVVRSQNVNYQELKADCNCPSGQNSEIQKILMGLIAENRRLALDGSRELESQLRSIREAINQLQSEVKEKNSKFPPFMALNDFQAMKQSDLMERLSDGLDDLAKEVGMSASNQTLLTSLWFSDIKDRQTNVTASHKRTYEWVFTSSSETDFQRWLRYENGVFWIKRKAGSGKSTLMKFLMSHSHTSTALQLWAGQKSLISASYFFWNAGSPMQKSQLGLLSSLLFDVLQQCPHLIQSVCCSKAQSFRPYESRLEPWTKQELWDAIHQLKTESRLTTRFCFFIDGLDEYDGEPDHIIEALKNLRDLSDIKLYVSSRPWNSFVDAFGRPCDPHLALEDLTRDDIRLYVRDTLEDNPRFRALKARDSRIQDLVLEIVEKARGVFLWFVLVVKSLLSGLQNADRILDLQKRLRNFPDTLEKYFDQMFNSIDPIYREETAQTFKFALEAVEPLTLLTYSFLDEEDLDALLASPRTSKLTDEDILLRKEDMQRRLNGRCMGLLELMDNKETNQDYRVLEPKVDFLHRTVYDFLVTKDLDTRLDADIRVDFSPKFYICKAFFAQLRSLNVWPQELLDDLVFYSRGLGTQDSEPFFILMDELGRVLSHRKSHPRFAEAEYLEYLVQRDHRSYIARSVVGRPITDSTKTRLLRAALIPIDTRHFKRNRALDRDLVQILLEIGAKPNSKFRVSTVWSSFLQSMNARTPQAPADYSREITGLLLLYGADPTLQIIIGQKTRTAKLTGRASDLHRSDAVDNEYRSAHAVMW